MKRKQVLATLVLSAIGMISVNAADTTLDTVYVYGDKDQQVITTAPGGTLTMGMKAVSLVLRK